VDRPDILDICARHNVDAVIPGYGFLSENETFARKIVDAGMVFVGPSVESILEMGLKHRARDLAIAAKVPVVPGTDLLTSETDALEAANRIGFPVSSKALQSGSNILGN
jgi:acetyl/propionyl-CoA carboxylase alpha subunit